MATSPDPFASPLAPRAGLSTAPDPFAPWTPTSGSGLGGLGSSTADMAVLAERLVRPSQFGLPDIKPPSRATPMYSPATKEMFVNGLRFAEDDAEAALRSEQYLNAPMQPAPAGDWVPLDDATYQQYLQNIRKPGLGQFLSKGFGRSVDQFQMLFGRGLQLAGAEGLGGRIVEQQMEDLRKTAPYSRQFTDVRSGDDLLDWLAVNAAEQGVNIIESIVTGALGFLAGAAATGNPLGAAAASLASVVGKETWKNGVKAALAKKVRGEALLGSETELLRKAAGIAGATVASVASGYAQGAADIYGEFREQGAGPDDVGARLKSLAGGLPYAALGFLPEAVLAARLMGRVGARPALSTLPTRTAKAGEILKRGAMGGAAGGALEGTTELAQEALLLSVTDQELGSPENIKRLINSFAAGVGIGGPIGAGANILSPINLMDRSGATGPVSTNQPVTPTAPVLPVTATPGTQGELFPITPGEMAGPAVSPLPPRPTPGVVPPQPGQMALFQPTAPSLAARMERGIMPPGPMAQGELALTGGAVAPGYTPPQALAPEAPVEPGLTPEEAAAQGALQFAPPAPEGRPVGAMANQLQAIQDRLRREREFANLQAQRAAEREAELDALQRTGQIGRDLFDATTLAAGAPVTEGLPPMVPAPRTPQQLPLFRGGLPRPTRRQLPPARAQAAPLPSAPAGVAPEQLALPGMAKPLTMEAAKAAWEDRRPANVRKWDALSEESRQAWADAIEEGTATPARRVEISRADSVARLKPKKAAPPPEPPTPPKPKKPLKPPKPKEPKGAKGEKLKTPAPPPPEEKPPPPKGGGGVPPPPPPPPPPAPVTFKGYEFVPVDLAGSDEEVTAKAPLGQGKGKRVTLKDGTEVELVLLRDKYGENAIVPLDSTGKPIGVMYFVIDPEGKAQPTVDVDRQFRRRGLATSMYDFAEELGARFQLAGGVRTRAGRAFREAREKRKAGATVDSGYLDPTKYVYHAVRSDADISSVMENGLRPGSNVSLGTDGQAFSGEGDTILVFQRGDVAPRTKEYQGDGLTSKAAKPVAILKDTSVEAGRETQENLEGEALKAQEEYDKLVEYAQREYDLSQEDVEAYAWGTKKIAEAPAEAQPLMKRLRALSKRVERLLEESERAPAAEVSEESVLSRYTQYGVPVQQVVVTVDGDFPVVTLGREAPKPAPAAPAPEVDEEAAAEAAEEAIMARAEADVDAGPIGQALAKIDDGDIDTKVKVRALAKKLERDGVLEDIDEVLEGLSDREQSAEDVLDTLRTLLDDARDVAIEERADELREEAAVVEETAPAAPTITDIADPSLAEVPTPEVLYRAAGQRQKYPGTFWSAIKDYVTKQYLKGARALRERTDLPKRTLNITTLAGLPPMSKNAMFADFRTWRSKNHPNVAIEDTYLYEVLVNDESDFPYPTEQDNEYLRSKGYDAVFFAQEGGEQVDTWYFIGETETAAQTPPVSVQLSPEEQWNEERSTEDVAYADLPEEAKVRWAGSNRSGEAQIEILRAVRAGRYFKTNAERLNYAIAAAEAAMEAAKIDLFEADNVISLIVAVAYKTPDGYTAAQQKEAIEFLQQRETDGDFNYNEIEAVRDAFALLAEGQRWETKTKKSKTGTGVAGDLQPWYVYALKTPGMMQRLGELRLVFLSLTLEEAQRFLNDGVLSEFNLPDNTVKNLNKVKAPEATKADEKKSAAKALADAIYELNTNRGVQLNTAAQEKKTQRLRDLWAAVVAEGTQDFLDQTGNPVSAYFDADGNPYVEMVSGEMRVNTTASTAETKAKREALLRETGKPAKGEPKVNTFEAWLNGRSFVDLDGKPIARTLDLGRVQFAVTRFLSKLLRKPKVHIFRNQADLKARNPQLHAKAAAERPGDFDTVNAVGYSFGDGQVIIFTDRVRTEAQLRFVLAHETLGHFGLRSLIPEREFNALMLDLYERSPGIRLAVDRAMEVRGLGKAEAVEEYLSDFAASLDVSFINRVWNAIKGALNKLGIQFGDEAARYLVGQARRYVYSGQRSAVFDTAAIMSRIQAMETGQDPYKTGRFAVAGDLRADNRAAGALYSSLGELPTNLPDAWNQIKGRVGDTFSSLDKFNQTVFSLFNFRARENPGLAALERVLSDGRGLSMRIKNALNEQLALVLNRAVEVPFSNIKSRGITEEQRAQLGKLLYDAQRYASSRLKRLSALGKTPLFSVDPATGVLTPNQPEIDKLFDQGLVSFEQALKGFSYTDTYMGPEGEPITEVVEIPGIEGLTKDSIVWEGYLKTREAMRNVELELLHARYLAFTQDRDLAFREIDAVTRGGKLTGEERQFFERMYRKYRDLWTADKTFDADGEPTLNPDSIDRANDFLVAFNTALIAKEKAANDAEAQRRNSALAEFFTGAAADDVVANIEAFKDRFIRTDETEFLIQNRIKDIVAGDISNSDADLYTKRTLATGYTPVLRRGSAQVRVVATTVDGKPVRLQQDYKDQLVYSQFEKQSEAVEMARTINETLFTAKTYKVMAFNENTLKFEMMDVKLQAVPEAALDAIAAPPDLNLNEFTRGLSQFDIVLPPAKLKQVLIALTRQNSRARQRLKRGFVEGADPDAVRAVAEHIEARASTIAKVVMRPKLSELTNLNLQSTQLLWNGDAAKLQALKAAWEADPQNTGVKRAYEAYAFMYNKTNPKSGVRRGNLYYNEGARAVHFLDTNRDVNESDFGAGKVASLVRAITSMIQLGGSIATGALNYLGAIVNSIPYLATYNEKTAFGGGFGLGPTIASFQRALSQVGLIKGVRGQFTDENLGTAEFYDRLIGETPQAEALRKRFGLTEDEARFMARETREGTMIPALSNSLVGTARGRVQSAAGQKFMDGWMWTFNSTEQAVRRAVGLAAYRMERARAIANGAKPADAAIKARDTAVNALNFTLGDYAVMNRPPLWQSGIQSFIYMYKVFPTTTIQVLSRLPRKGQFYMLASLFLLGGIAAFPFAEDLEDILDTIAQGLGLKMASVRVELAQMLDEVFPGMSPYVLRGFANSYFPGNIADRVSVGNFIPGTGIALAGANVGRELTDVAGPAVGMLLGVATSSIDLLRAMTTERVTMIDVLRESPVTMGRALGDTIAYVQSGAIVDRRGYVVSQEIPMTMLAARLLGFYPSEAAQQYDVIRASKRIVDYQKETVAGFRTAWIKAKIQGDEAQARAIVESVNDWNEGARGTALEIRNFLPNANRALREAQRPAGERFLRAAPRAAREELSTIESLLGYTD